MGKVNSNLLVVHFHALELCFYCWYIERDPFLEGFSRIFHPQIVFFLPVRKTPTCTEETRQLSLQKRNHFRARRSFPISLSNDQEMRATKSLVFSQCLMTLSFPKPSSASSPCQFPKNTISGGSQILLHVRITGGAFTNLRFRSHPTPVKAECLKVALRNAQGIPVFSRVWETLPYSPSSRGLYQG